MRRLFRFFMGLIITALVLVGLVFGFLYTNEKPPTLTAASLEIKDIIIDEIDDLLDENNEDKKLTLTISENDINYLLKQELEKTFEYDGTSDYLFEQGPFKVQGAWVKVKDTKKIDIIVGMHLDIGFLTFKSRVLIQLEVVTTDNSDIVITLKKVNLGRLPLRWLVKLAPNLAKSMMGFDIEEVVNESLNNLGTYDSKKLAITVDFTNIFDGGIEKELIKLIKEEKIVNLSFKKDGDNSGVSLGVDLNSLKTDKERRVLLPSEKIETEDDFQDFMQNKILTSILIGNNSLILSEKDLDKIIDYMLKDMINNNLLMEQELYEDYNLMIGVPYFELKTAKSNINIPLMIGDTTNSFDSNVEIQIVLSKNNNDLELELSNFIVGTLEVSEGLSDELLNMLKEGNDMFDEGKIVLKDFFVEFANQGLDVTAINMLDGSLELEIDGFDFSGLVQEIIDEINIPELNDILNDILDNIDDGLDVDDLLEDLEDVLDDLTEEELEDLLDLISDYI